MTLKRIACLLLILMLIASFAPLTPRAARAEESAPEPIIEGGMIDAAEEVEVQPVDDIVPVAEDLDIGAELPSEPLEDAVEAPLEVPEETEIELEDNAAEDIPAEDSAPEETVEELGADDPVVIQEDEAESLEKSAQSLFAAGVASSSAIKHSIALTQSGATVTINGSISAPYYVCGLFDENVKLITAVRGSSINQTINMNNYATGYHTFLVGVSDGPTSNNVVGMVTLTHASSNKITATPTYNGVFDVYHDYFNYYPYDMGMNNQSGDLYMEYSSDNGNTWKRSGYMRANMIKLYIQQAYSISGLSPNTTYLTRIRYGSFVTYSESVLGDGKSYFFGGPVLNTTTIKTGAATAPTIKSVTIKSTKVKRHKVRHAGYYNVVGGSVFWHKAYTERFYTCNLKVTVKLKAKPGTNGMWISCGGQTKFVAGNKKKYVATFTPYPNYFAKKPKGHYRYTATIRSGQSSTWGGFSPSVNVTKKLK